MSNLANTSPALDKLATSLNSLYTQMEKCYVTVCETMGAAREHFDDDAEIWSWVEDTTPFKSRTAYDYLAVYENVLVRHGATEKTKSMTF